MDCEVCDRAEAETPMTFKNDRWCSDRCRKVVLGEVQPTEDEWVTMTPALFKELGGVCRE